MYAAQTSTSPLCRSMPCANCSDSCSWQTARTPRNASGSHAYAQPAIDIDRKNGGEWRKANLNSKASIIPLELTPCPMHRWRVPRLRMRLIATPHPTLPPLHAHGHVPAMLNQICVGNACALRPLRKYQHMMQPACMRTRLGANESILARVEKKIGIHDRAHRGRSAGDRMVVSWVTRTRTG
jgi:hypothetical protein